MEKREAYPLAELLAKYIHPVVLGSLSRSSSLGKLIAKRVLSLRNVPEAEADALAAALNGGYPSHFFPILRSEARRLGLPVTDASPELVHENEPLRMV